MIKLTNKQTTGWHASLELTFSHEHERTALMSAAHCGPLTVQRPFYPEGDTCHLYILHPPGGIVGGDSMDITVRLTNKSHTLLTMPGSTKFYRSGGTRSIINQHFYLEQGTTLEWLPQDSIFFRGAQADLNTVFKLASSSTLLAWDFLCLGRPVIGERFDHGSLHCRMEVWLEGIPLQIERLCIEDGDLDNIKDAPWIGTLLFYPVNASLLDETRQRLEPLGNFAGATLDSGLMTIRFLGMDNLVCQKVMRDIWCYLRPYLTGKQPVTPRIWLT
ncbi:urease accessory protein UreD [Salmonella enterica subsp. enterica]|nr:urease accessory protein UreD [Salmonella enterica subsp. enterica serovar Chailey]